MACCRKGAGTHPRPPPARRPGQRASPRTRRSRPRELLRLELGLRAQGGGGREHAPASAQPGRRRAAGLDQGVLRAAPGVPALRYGAGHAKGRKEARRESGGSISLSTCLQRARGGSAPTCGSQAFGERRGERGRKPVRCAPRTTPFRGRNSWGGMRLPSCCPLFKETSMKPLRSRARAFAAVVAVVLAVVFAVFVGARLFGGYRWDAGTQRLRDRLEAAREPVRPQTVDFRELEGLPAPVRRYFRTVLTEGQPMVSRVRVGHMGTFNMGEGEDQWKPF